MPPTHDSEPALEDSVATILKTLPAPIRDYVVEKKYESVVASLSRKYELHIDQAGTLEQNILLLLLGVNTPDEFSESLEGDAGIAREQVYKIIEDLNEQIFVPLKEGVRGAGNTSETPPKPPSYQNKAAETPSPENLSSLPPKSALPRATPPVLAAVPAVAPPRPSVPPPAQTLPAPKPSINKLQGWRSDAPETPTPPTEQPATQKSSGPAPALTGTDLQPLPPASAPVNIPVSSAPIPPTPAVLRTAPPPPNLPGAIVSSDPSEKPSVPLTKSYATDPYREPIDDR